MNQFDPIPPTFSVSQVRSAATCPRLFYFDTVKSRVEGLGRTYVTRVWKSSDRITACGSLFHNAVAQFQKHASSNPELCDATEFTYHNPTTSPPTQDHPVFRAASKLLSNHCINLSVFHTRSPDQKAAFTQAVNHYLRELVEIIRHAANDPTRPSPEQLLLELFGDTRRAVNVTFQVGKQNEQINVRGILDYIFYDRRRAGHWIIDYKLTPAHHPNNDLFQVSLYSLMHDIQHDTQPGVAVTYLHPQPQRFELSWDQVKANAPIVHNLLASMREWSRYDETTQTGLKPPGEPSICPSCRWRHECVARLGHRLDGARVEPSEVNVNSSSLTVVKVDPQPQPYEPIEPLESDDDVEPNGTLVSPPPGMVAPADFSDHVATASTPTTPPSSATATTTSPARSTPRLRGATSKPYVDPLWIGTLKQGREVRLPLDALPTHTAVVGAAGSGKTWMAKVLTEEALLNGIPVIAIDPQGDLVQFLHGAPASRLDAMPPEHRARHDELRRRIRVRIWTPGSSHARRFRLDPLHLPTRDQFEHAVKGTDQDELQGLISLTASRVVALAAAGGSISQQETFILKTLQNLIQQGQTSITWSELASIVMNPSQGGFQEGEADLLVKRSEREKLARQLNTLQHGTSANLFNHGEPLSIRRMVELEPWEEGPGAVPLNVVYLNALIDSEQKRFVVAAMAEEISRWMMNAGGSPNHPWPLVYLDEAFDFLPAGTVKPVSKPPLIRLFAQGRKYGVCGLICTQSPRSVDQNLFSNCSTKIIGRLESAADIDRVREWFQQGGSPSWLNSRLGCAAGSFMGRWPNMMEMFEGQPFQTRPLYSLHEGAWSPERVEQEWSRWVEIQRSTSRLDARQGGVDSAVVPFR
ncbi:AAA ATPase [Isosphaera pallida ATCC 43644]|uniref:AAA ATPase n=1 Tax=Isosphaera pallida (strain ATCC 43644 / DSM 9630 / IS1B) TaxID=575540 RepID=E8QYU7_ISOPI|nr:PD-(D/E)XK nuclease family protein [Isosphaera pallida]ADV62084.1 AAA ATPase [Isosphaera pallida ATCC 43644]